MSSKKLSSIFAVILKYVNYNTNVKKLAEPVRSAVRKTVISARKKLRKNDAVIKEHIENAKTFVAEAVAVAVKVTDSVCGVIKAVMGLKSTLALFRAMF